MRVSRLNFSRLMAATGLSILFAFSVIAGPKDAAWKDEKGQPAPDTEFRKSKDNFGGWLVVTPDADWKEKWETSEETIPHFTTASTVERGKAVSVLIFIVNPAVDAKNNVDVTCDIQSIRPDGSVSINQRNLPALKGELNGNPSNIRLAAPVIKFVGEPNDLAGKWIMRVMLKDKNRKVELRLQTSFRLK